MPQLESKPAGRNTDQVDRVVADFYNRLQTDTSKPPLWRHFEVLPEARQRTVANHVGYLLRRISGEGEPLNARDLNMLQTVHARTAEPITAADYDRTVGHLAQACVSGGLANILPQLEEVAVVARPLIVRSTEL